jgi:hypothetical protein
VLLQNILSEFDPPPNGHRMRASNLRGYLEEIASQAIVVSYRRGFIVSKHSKWVYLSVVTLLSTYF